ncbi:ATP-binding protein [Methanobrevibacter sp.]|jgi:SpoVK/Ycf46/Vps4 family AAA+-type ATPase|uniref:ATP-binding protein n=1 Tax=Methanobrevibacter sp. TaxID=66852 RepID=UPI0025ED1A41|nr:ATP-binding protein [uncultured Methanobrevibacter sp.]
MKKRSILSLIKYYAEKNDVGFRNEAYEIAKEFDKSGDYQLSEYIMSLLSNVNTFVPQVSESVSPFFERIEAQEDMLLLPDAITNDLLGVVNVVEHNIGINKFLFQGVPGTGKTEAVKQLARILNRDLFMVDFSAIVDSKLGQTQKNLAALFKEINSFVQPKNVIVLFDEIDAIALDRTNSNDLREMGRATTAILKGLDRMKEDVVLIATTNLFEHFDKALIRRFDLVIDFNRYTKEDLLLISERLLDRYLDKFKLANRDIRLFRKIMNLLLEKKYPGDLKNLIKTSVAFSNPHDGMDYFRKLYYSICGEKPNDLKKLQAQKFTVREIEILTGRSKSSVARDLKGQNVDELHSSIER